MTKAGIISNIQYYASLRDYHSLMSGYFEIKVEEWRKLYYEQKRQEESESGTSTENEKSQGCDNSGK